MKIQIEQSRSGQYFWRIRADNGQVLATSETYTTKSTAKKTAESVTKGVRQVQIEDLSSSGNKVTQVSRRKTVKRRPTKKAAKKTTKRPARKRAAKRRSTS